MGTKENMELVRRGYAAFSAGDVEGLKQVIAPDAVHTVPGDISIAGAHKGIDNILTLYGQLAERSNGTMKLELEAVVTDGADRVIAVQRATATREGRTLDAREALLFTISGDRVVEIQDFFPDIDANDAFWA